MDFDLYSNSYIFAAAINIFLRFQRVGAVDITKFKVYILDVGRVTSYSATNNEALSNRAPHLLSKHPLERHIFAVRSSLCSSLIRLYINLSNFGLRSRV